MEIRKFQKSDLPEMVEIWNEVVESGNAFPQEEFLNAETGEKFFSSQSYTGVAWENGRIYGLYILHPNNIGRCGHICNASYAVSSESRGKHIGEKLVLDCIMQALYERTGFKQLGTIPNGFRMKDGSYANICPYFIEL